MAMPKKTSLARRLTSGVARLLPNVVAYKDKVILLPQQEYLVRGFLFERTAYSDYAYLWELIAPLYNPGGANVPLNHSRRISVGPKHYVIQAAVTDALEGVCAQLSGVLQRTFLPELSAITTIESWFRARPPEVFSRQRLNILLDYAVGYALCNEEQRAANLLKQIVDDPDEDEYSLSVKKVARERLVELKSGVSRIRQSVQPIVAENLRRQFPVLVGV